MAYRNDQLAMKQRIAQLEGELASAQETIARLKGQMDERSSDDLADMLTKEQLHHLREIDLEIDDEGIEAIADMLRQRLPNSQVSMVGKKLHCKWNTATLEVTRHEGRTEIRLKAFDPRSKALLALGGFGFAVLGGPMVAGAFAALAAALGVTLASWLGVAFAPVALLLGYLAMDKLTAYNLRTARTTLRGALEAAVELVHDHGHEPAPLRIEVATEAESSVSAAQEAAEAEAQQAEAQQAEAQEAEAQED